MSGKSSIEWTDSTWNPTTGCTKVSPGCTHCYAERFAERWRGIPGHPFEHGFDPMARPDRLQDPLHWKTPRRVFVNSMSDLFHTAFDDQFIFDVFDVMRDASRHTFQVLTKRPERMRRVVRQWFARRFKITQPEAWKPEDVDGMMPSNIWLGVSIENMDYAWRAENLLETPASIRFLSLEPLLGPIYTDVLLGMQWVIVGGESGAGARPINVQWVRSIRDDCASLEIPFFFKQYGGATKKRGGDEAILDGRRHHAYPSRTEVAR
jgi:protein gp37